MGTFQNIIESTFLKFHEHLSYFSEMWELKGGRTPPTQFFVDGCYARLLLLYTYRGFNTRTKYLPKAPLTNFRANLEEILGRGYNTL